MNKHNMQVLTNTIGAVESGGQIYGKQRYDAYTPPYTNSDKEHTITLGWAQNYGYEAKRLVKLIYDINPANFRNLDPRGSIQDMLDKDWVAIKWKPSITQKNILIKLIDSAAGHEAQDMLFEELMNKYIKDCEAKYTKSTKAVMMYCEIRHLGGGAVDRIFKRCNGDYSLTSIMNSLKKDQNDTSNNNQVGDKKFWSRHEKCYEFINKYAEDESKLEEKEKMATAYNPQKVIDVANSWVGYLEKKNGNLTYLKDKTANAGDNNYTWFGYTMHNLCPSTMDYPAAWCDCFVDFCFYSAYGESAAKKLLCGGFDDYTVNSAQKYKNKWQWHTKNPKVGDQIFFKNTTRICHTGLVYKVDNSKVYTIEGNTSGASGVIANGGGVCKKSYDLTNSRIAGYGRPDYGMSASGGETKGGYMFTVSDVYLNKHNNSVLLLQEIFRARGYKDQYGALLEIDGHCGERTVWVINWYQTSRRKQGVELGSNGKNDSVCGQKMWADLLAL